MASFNRFELAALSKLSKPFTDGTRLTERVGAVRGTSDNPMTREEVVAKARDLVVPVFFSEKCSNLIDTIFKLEELRDIRELRSLLQS